VISLLGVVHAGHGSVPACMVCWSLSKLVCQPARFDCLSATTFAISLRFSVHKRPFSHVQQKCNESLHIVMKVSMSWLAKNTNIQSKSGKKNAVTFAQSRLHVTVS